MIDLETFGLPSEWFHGILKLPELRNYEKTLDFYRKMKLLKESLYFLRFFDMFFKILDISFDVCKKCSGTCMELFKNSENPCRFFKIFEMRFSKLLIFR